MKTQTLQQSYQGKFSTELAIGSFMVGTLFLVLHLLFPNEDGIVILGFLYVLFACLINGLMLINLIYHFIILPEQREYIAIKALILLSNIPITYLYILIIFNK